MSNEHTTRREALKAVTAIGVVGGLSPTASADAPAVRVVETGLRYEAPMDDRFELIRPDSRPPYTVNAERRELLLLNTASRSDRRAIRNAPELTNEQSVATGTKVRVNPGELGALPTELSSRMRVKEAIPLNDHLRTPTVTARPSSDGVVLATEGRGQVSVPVGKRTTVELNPVTATVRTSRVVGRADVDDDVPEFMVGLKREYGSREVDVRPVVEVINHGKLAVAQQPDPPADAPTES
jgi:hypothetical protein